MKPPFFASVSAVCFAVGIGSVVFADTTAYIANSGADEVVRVTTDNEAMVTTPIAGGPYGIAVTPNGQQVLVTNVDDDELAFFDTDNFSGTPFLLAVGNSPRGVAIDPSGRYAYVANYDDDTISQIDVSKRITIDTIGVDDGPWGVAAHYDEPENTPVVYVANHNDDSITVIDKDNQTTILDVGDGPIGLAITPDGAHVYVANTNDDTVSIINTRDLVVTDTVVVGSDPWGIAVGADGKYVYVTNSGANTVTVIQTADHSIARTFAVGKQPRGVAAPRNGNFAYVINQNGGSISKIDMDDDTVTEFAAGLIDGAYAIGAFIGDKPPSRPSDLKLETRSDNGIDLGWVDNSADEWGFKIERSKENEDNFIQITTVAKNATTYRDFGLVGDTVYFYRIRSYNEAADSEFSVSADSATKRFEVSVWCFIDTMKK